MHPLSVGCGRAGRRRPTPPFIRSRMPTPVQVQMQDLLRFDSKPSSDGLGEYRALPMGGGGSPPLDSEPHPASSRLQMPAGSIPGGPPLAWLARQVGGGTVSLSSRQGLFVALNVSGGGGGDAGVGGTDAPYMSTLPPGGSLFGLGSKAGWEQGYSAAPKTPGVKMGSQMDPRSVD
eukprot:gene448-1850_t